MWCHCLFYRITKMDVRTPSPSVVIRGHPWSSVVIRIHPCPPVEWTPMDTDGHQNINLDTEKAPKKKTEKNVPFFAGHRKGTEILCVKKPF